MTKIIGFIKSCLFVLNIIKSDLIQLFGVKIFDAKNITKI